MLSTLLSVMLSLLTNEVWIAWGVSFLLFASSGLVVSAGYCLFHFPWWLIPLFNCFPVVVCGVITPGGTVAVEISYYYVWQFSMDEHLEFKLVVWWFVHRMHNYSRHHNSYYLNSSLSSFIDALNLQVVSNENSNTILLVGTFSY